MLLYGDVDAMTALDQSKDENRTPFVELDGVDSIYAETMADYEWEDEYDDDTFLYFTIKFIAEEGEGLAVDGKPMKNRLIESYSTVVLEKIKQKEGYQPGITPLKHQKIRIKYEKKEPIMFFPLENLKYQDEQGQIFDLDSKSR